MASGNNLALPEFLTRASPGNPDWRVVGVVDLNGDGRPDVLFQDQITGDMAVWYMNGANLTLGKLLTPSNPGGYWQVKAP